ncbi:hypothetical protein VNO77_44338 [Canavalia gladiata]|uniref:Uncharacterized protein n=1 Tax=Canavalia gladiata TaxID=3824 RepID=A0AAN9JZJ4_CANGL
MIGCHQTWLLYILGPGSRKRFRESSISIKSSSSSLTNNFGEGQLRNNAISLEKDEEKGITKSVSVIFADVLVKFLEQQIKPKYEIYYQIALAIRDKVEDYEKVSCYKDSMWCIPQLWRLLILHIVPQHLMVSSKIMQIHWPNTSIHLKCLHLRLYDYGFSLYLIMLMLLASPLYLIGKSILLLTWEDIATTRGQTKQVGRNFLVKENATIRNFTVASSIEEEVYKIQ